MCFFNLQFQKLIVILVFDKKVIITTHCVD